MRKGLSPALRIFLAKPGQVNIRVLKAGGKIERIWILFYFKYGHRITRTDSTQLLVSCRVTVVSRACARLWMARTIWS